jgi:hypothetical protein
MCYRDDRLPRFAEPHVIGENRPSSSDKKGYALDLVGKETSGQVASRFKSFVRVTWYVHSVAFQ